MISPHRPPLDSLSLFLQAWLSRRMIEPGVGGDLIQNIDNFTATRIFRSGNYQVELISVLPHTEVPNHVHPHMDSYEVYLGGDITFRVDGVSFIPTKVGEHIRVKSDCPHGGTFGAAGGVFLSVQEWKDGPQSAGTDWRFADSAEISKAKAVPQ